MLDAHLDLISTDIPSKHFVCLQGRLSRRLEDVFSVTIFSLSRRLQDVLKTKNCYVENVLKTSSKHVSKISSGRPKDQQMFAGL